MNATPIHQHRLTCGQVLIFENASIGSLYGAERIAEVIREALRTKDRAVLGLATGSTPIAVYAHLAQMHERGELSFARCSTYNLDEYYPISPLDPNSYRRFMVENLFSKVDLPPNQGHVLDGTVPRAFVDEECQRFDRWIEAEGGLDVQLLGIGRNGHIGFNEPSDLGVEAASGLPTRLTTLHPVTREDAAKDFGGHESAVPSEALTLGTRQILRARTILLLAFGARKAEIVAKALQEQPTSQVPASLLQKCSNRVTWVLDPAAASRLAL